MQAGQVMYTHPASSCVSHKSSSPALSSKQSLTKSSDQTRVDERSSFVQHPINVDKYEEPPMSFWIKDLGLHMKDKNAICSGGWLNDRHLSAMNKLLRAQFPSQEGLQDSLLLAKYST